MSDDAYCKLFPLKQCQAIIDKAKESITLRNGEFKSHFNEWCEILTKSGHISRDCINNLEKMTRSYQEKPRNTRSVELSGLHCSLVTLGEYQSSYTRPFVNYVTEELPQLMEIFPNLCDCLVSACCGTLTKFSNYVLKLNEQHSKLLATYLASHNKFVKENNKLIKRKDKKSVSEKSTKSKMSSSLKSYKEAYSNYSTLMQQTAIINQGFEGFRDSVFKDIVFMSDAGLQVIFNILFEGLVEVLDIQTSKIPPYSSLLSSIHSVFSMETDEKFYVYSMVNLCSECEAKNICKSLSKKPNILSDDDNDYLNKFGEKLIEQKEKIINSSQTVTNMKSLKTLKDSVGEIITEGCKKKNNWKALKPKIVSALGEFDEQIMAMVKLRSAEVSGAFLSGNTVEVHSNCFLSFFHGDGKIKFSGKIFPMGTWACGCKIFGGNLEDHCKNSGFEISPIILFCVEKIEELNLSTEGVFRLAGRQSNIKKLKYLLEAGCFYLHCGIFEYCDILKMYIRDLEKPLLPDDTLSLLEKEVKKENITRMKEIVGSMPEVNRKNLHYLCVFLERVCALSEKNKMTRANLALLFATNINNKIANILDNNSIKVVFLLLSHNQEIFTDKLKAHDKICPSVCDIDDEQAFGMAKVERKSAQLESFEISEEEEELPLNDSDHDEDIVLDSFINTVEAEETLIEGPPPYYIFELAWLPALVEFGGSKFNENWSKCWRISGFSLFEDKKSQKTINETTLSSLAEDVQKYFMFDFTANPNNEFDPHLLNEMWNLSGEAFGSAEKYLEKCFQLRSQFDVDGILTKAKINPSNLLFYMREDVNQVFKTNLNVTPRLVIKKTLLLKIQIFMKEDFSLVDSPYNDKNEPLRFAT